MRAIFSHAYIKKISIKIVGSESVTGWFFGVGEQEDMSRRTQESENVLSSPPPVSAKSSSWGLAPSRFATANLGKLYHLLYTQTTLHTSHKKAAMTCIC